MSICQFITTHMVAFVSIATALQVVGTLLLSAFSFFGLKITVSPNVFVNNKPVTHIEVLPKWLAAAKVGLTLLTLGILLSSIASIVSAQQGAPAERSASASLRLHVG